METKKCIFCGEEMPSEMNYCLKCMHIQKAEEVSTSKYPGSFLEKNKLYFICAGALSALMITIAVIIFISGKDKSSHTLHDILNNSSYSVSVDDDGNIILRTPEGTTQSDIDSVQVDGYDVGIDKDGNVELIPTESTLREAGGAEGIKDIVNSNNTSSESSSGTTTSTTVQSNQTSVSSDSQTGTSSGESSTASPGKTSSAASITTGDVPESSNQSSAPDQPENAGITTEQFSDYLRSSAQSCNYSYYSLIPPQLDFSQSGKNTVCSFKEGGYGGNVRITYHTDLSVFSVQLDEAATASHKNSLPALEVSMLAGMGISGKNAELYNKLNDDSGYIQESVAVKHKAFTVNNYSITVTETTHNTYDSVLGKLYSYKSYLVYGKVT